MQFITVGLAIIVSIVLFIGIIALLRKPVEQNEQMVILPKFVLIIGLICSVAFLIPSLIILSTNEAIFLSVMFIAFSLLGTSFIIAYLNCRIKYNETNFTAKNFLGIKHTYTYDEITSIHDRSMDVKLYIGKQIVRIDEFSVGKEEFLFLVRKQYQSLNNGKSIPTAAPKSDIFNGNVEHAGEFIFVYILISLLCIGTIVLITLNFAPKSTEDLEYASLSFERYEFKDEDLLLYEMGDLKYYSIPAYKELLSDTDKFLALCDEGLSFDIGYVIYDNTDVPYYGLESIVGEDGTVYLTIEDIHQYYQKDIWILYLLMGGLTMAWFAFTALSIYVGRHPEKFSPRFIRLFFKDGYVHRSSSQTKY